MSILLFKHNVNAYYKAPYMHKIIHSICRSKSFISFKLCEDKPSSTVY